MKANTPHLHSLRKRAIFFSAAISILIVMVSISGYLNVKNLYNESSSSLLKREELLVRFNLIHTELLYFYKELNSFLLTPENKQSQKNIIISINELLRLSKELTLHEWIKKYKREKTANKLNLKLEMLKKDVNELIRVRLDPTNQFPSLAVGSAFMQPNRIKLNSAIALAINEMEADNTLAKNPTIYKTIIQIRYLWGEVLSTNRIYLANRVGSFLESGLVIQEKSVETLYKELQRNLAKLKKMADAGKLGFESTDAVNAMISSSIGWYDGFKKVKTINHSNEWRQDAKIMNEKISPSINVITNLLISLEKIVNESSINDVNLINSLANTQNKILWLIAFIGIFFTAVIILSLDKLIFIPIASVSKALKLEAAGKQSDDLLVVKTRETEDLVNAFNEMSRQVHSRQTELEYRALHDSLTALPNRTLLLDRVEQGIHEAKRENAEFSLLLLDLDDFKDVNDTLGHSAGDNLLIEVGGRISRVLREVDTIARIGGDEFSILLPHTNEEQAIIISQKILASINESIEVDDIEVSISSSIGIAIYPEHGEDVQTLLRHSDIAMYVAKRNKIGFEVYHTDVDDHSISKLSLIKDFRDAIENNKLSLNFQPIFNIKSNNIVAVEALSRWDHPEEGYISPEKFIPMAEQTGLINSLTHWVLDRAIEQVSIWHQLNFDFCVAVNLSVNSFKDPEFMGIVRSILRKYNFPTEKLKFEITESAMMENPLQAIEVLTELHNMGVKLSIDDFGTGFSSMTYLKQLPVNELKIDKSFIIGLDIDKSNDAIVRSTIDLAHNLGLVVVAEGIETETVHNLLRNYKCDMAQGYHLSRPVTAEKLEEILKSI